MRQLLQPGGFQRKVGTKFPAGIWLGERTLTSNLSIANIAVGGGDGFGLAKYYAFYYSI